MTSEVEPTEVQVMATTADGLSKVLIESIIALSDVESATFSSAWKSPRSIAAAIAFGKSSAIEVGSTDTIRSELAVPTPPSLSVAATATLYLPVTV